MISYTYYTRSKFNSCSIIVIPYAKSQFTTNAQSVLPVSPCTLEHVYSWTVAPLQRSRSGCEWFEGHQICAGKVSLRFKLKLNTLGVFKYPLGRKSKGLSSGELGGCTLHTKWANRIYLVLLWEIQFWSLSKHFRCTLFIVTF